MVRWFQFVSPHSPIAEYTYFATSQSHAKRIRTKCHGSPHTWRGTNTNRDASDVPKNQTQRRPSYVT